MHGGPQLAQLSQLALDRCMKNLFRHSTPVDAMWMRADESIHQSEPKPHMNLRGATLATPADPTMIPDILGVLSHYVLGIIK